MSLPDDVLDLIDDRLDGDLDDDAWRELQRRHGAELERALERARQVRAAVGALPRPALPDSVEAAIRTQVAAIAPSTTTRPETSAAADTTERPPPPPADDSTIRVPWWSWVMPLVAAAVLAIVAIPTLRERLGQPASSMAEDRAVAEHGAKGTDKGDGLAVIDEVTTRDESPASRPPAVGTDQNHRSDPTGSTAETARPATDSPAPSVPVFELGDRTAEAADDQPVPRPPPARAKDTWNALSASEAAADAARDDPSSSRTVRPAADAAPTMAKTAAPPDSVEADTSAAATGDTISDTELAELKREARRFHQRADDRAYAKTAPDDQVVRDALAQELARRGVSDPEALLDDYAAVHAHNTDVDLAMQLVRDDNGHRHLLVAIHNANQQPLAGLGSVVQVEGLDANDTVIWRRPLPWPGDRRLAAGARTVLRLHLGRDLTPPNTVAALRLRSGDRTGPALALDDTAAAAGTLLDAEAVDTGDTP